VLSIETMVTANSKAMTLGGSLRARIKTLGSVLKFQRKFRTLPNIDREITEDMARLASSLYKKSK
jgi:hypothetical protein